MLKSNRRWPNNVFMQKHPFQNVLVGILIFLNGVLIFAILQILAFLSSFFRLLYFLKLRTVKLCFLDQNKKVLENRLFGHQVENRPTLLISDQSPPPPTEKLYGRIILYNGFQSFIRQKRRRADIMENRVL